MGRGSKGRRWKRWKKRGGEKSESEDGEKKRQREDTHTRGGFADDPVMYRYLTPIYRTPLLFWLLFLYCYSTHSIFIVVLLLLLYSFYSIL